MSDRPLLDGVLIGDLFATIAPFYGLKDDGAFHELTEYLVGLSCRDQEDEDTVADVDIEVEANVSRRSEGYRLAISVRQHAAQMLASLDSIHTSLMRFHAVVQLHPPLLEAIFDVDTGDPRNLFFPQNIEVLLSFFEELDWENAAAALDRLAAIPVRDKLPRGPMNNQTLRRAVQACQAYWRDAEGRSWSMSSLKVKAVRDQNEPRNLQGTCEAFVADVIRHCGIIYGLHDLCSAWTAVDQR